MLSLVNTWYRQAATAAAVAPQRRGLVLAVDLLHLIAILWREIRRAKVGVQSAMLTLWTAVAVPPLLLLAFALTGPLGVTAEAQAALRELLYDTVLASSVDELGGAIDALLASANLRALGLAGMFGLLLAGAQLFFKVEAAYNDLFDSRVRRSWLLRFIVFYAVVTLGQAAVAWAMLATAGVTGGASSALSVLLTAGVLVGMLRVLPDARVGWPAALAGGLCSTLLFEGAKTLFSAYMALFAASSAQSVVFGSLAFLPFSLLWMDLVWYLVLVGVKFGWVVEHRGRLMPAQRDAALDPGTAQRRPDGLFALAALTCLCGHFQAGKGAATADQVAEALGTSPAPVSEVLDVLEDAGLVVATNEQAWLPARPPDQITGAAVIRAWQAAMGLRHSHLPGGLSARLSAAEAALEVPLSQLVANAARG